MGRIAQAFEKGAPLLIGYLPAGLGGVENSYAAFSALVEGGVDLLEVGIPFSEPVAEGLIIQAAMASALQEGATPEGSLEVVARLRESYPDLPLVLMSYANPLHIGGAEFYIDATHAGVDGMIVVDLPVEEADEHLALAQEVGINPIFMATKNSSPHRVRELLPGKAAGFLYYVLQRGTTGVREALPKGAAEEVAHLREVVDLPIAAGFGLSTRSQIAEVMEFADGAIIGSILLSQWKESGQLVPSDLYKLVQELDPR